MKSYRLAFLLWRAFLLELAWLDTPFGLVFNLRVGARGYILVFLYLG
jgi:hypothetical protein